MPRKLKGRVSNLRVGGVRAERGGAGKRYSWLTVESYLRLYTLGGRARADSRSRSFVYPWSKDTWMRVWEGGLYAQVLVREKLEFDSF